MIIRFFEDPNNQDLLPLTATRPAAALRVGILSIAEKWSHLLKADSTGYLTKDYLQGRFPNIQADLHINGQLLPDAELITAVSQLTEGQGLYTQNGECLAYKGEIVEKIDFQGTCILIQRPFHIFKYNGLEIHNDFQLLTKGRETIALSPTNTVIGNNPIFLEEGAQVECCIFNTQNGPIYIGKNAQIMEGSIIRGPFAMGEGSNVKMGSKIYGDTTLGPYCNVGGEVNNVVFQGYSNKGHDGFLGNAVLGEWCNIGADTNASNLKNTYDEVKVWNYSSNRFEKSGEQFCGLIMGDHSKCGINTMFNTGTVVGVGSNIFGSGFPRQFVPDFAWGGASGFVTHKLPQMEKTAQLMMQRRKRNYDAEEMGIIRAVFESTQEHRTWERETEN
jgi:UDP-N-acetylglucosamine diphosphorylase/glucosamine-1-phosphate N-acetyltransferase